MTPATFGGGAAIRADGNQNHGLVATTDNADGSAVRGTNTVGAGVGVFGQGMFGVYGDSETQYGVYGTSTSGYGVAGISSSGTALSGGSATGYGIRGHSESGVGLYADSDSNDAVLGTINVGFKSGIVGVNPNTDGWAGYFEGDVHITGTLTPASAISRIDHPLDPANRTLAHAFVGSPEMKNVYDGTVTLDMTGQATVKLPSYFDALNASIRYQLTAIGAAAPDLHVAAKVKDNRFKIAGGQPGIEVSWQVTGVRQDAHAKATPIAVEAQKPAVRRGRYLNPLAHGQDASKGWKEATPRPELPARPIQPAP